MDLQSNNKNNDILSHTKKFDEEEEELKVNLIFFFVLPLEDTTARCGAAYKRPAEEEEKTC